jgi:hypothetical protein
MESDSRWDEVGDKPRRGADSRWDYERSGGRAKGPVLGAKAQPPSTGSPAGGDSPPNKVKKRNEVGGDSPPYLF